MDMPQTESLYPITVLIVTRDDEDFIRDQLDSLFAQSIRNFHIVILDAGSKDNTPHIIEAYSERFPGRLTLELIKGQEKPRTFYYMDLMSRYRSDYTFLSDQDDVWKYDKMEQSLKVFKEHELVDTEKEDPLLLYTDVEVCSRYMSMTAPSWKKATDSPSITTLKESLVTNDVFFATALYNAALGSYLATPPAYFLTPGWWLSMIAIQFGKKIFLDKPLLSFREHDGKEAKWATPENHAPKVGKFFSRKVTHPFLLETYRQIGCFVGEYELLMERETIEMCQAYSSLSVVGAFERRKILRREKFWRKGFSWRFCQKNYG